MTASTILIVTNTDDLHADIVSDKIAGLGGGVFRLNLDAFPETYPITLSRDGGAWRGAIRNSETGVTLRPSQIGAVWLRKRGAYSFRSPLQGRERRFAEQETEHLLLGWLMSLTCFWMSHPVAVRAASRKLEQLERAGRFGFNTPPSLVTTSRDDVERFRRSAPNGVIYKPMSSARLGGGPPDADAGADDEPDRVLPTTRITEDNADALDAVSETPCLFQHDIPKRHETRITVIDETVFAAKIDSQADPRTAADYRDFSADIRYDLEELPPAIEKRCRDYVRSYGLTFGAIDMIVTPDGDYVFLEINPVGQFLFVEELAPALRMTDALARRLIEAAQRHGG